jgi:hypothetical protein
LALASLTGVDRSIGIVHLRTKNHGVLFVHPIIFLPHTSLQRHVEFPSLTGTAYYLYVDVSTVLLVKRSKFLTQILLDILAPSFWEVSSKFTGNLCRPAAFAFNHQ